MSVKVLVSKALVAFMRIYTHMYIQMYSAVMCGEYTQIEAACCTWVKTLRFNWQKCAYVRAGVEACNQQIRQKMAAISFVVVNCRDKVNTCYRTYSSLQLHCQYAAGGAAHGHYNIHAQVASALQFVIFIIHIVYLFISNGLNHMYIFVCTLGCGCCAICYLIHRHLLSSPFSVHVLLSAFNCSSHESLHFTCKC